MNVFSCFDGASCGQLALKKLGIPITNYYASEIDKYAIQVTQANFPNTIQLGDITIVDTSQLPKIDLMMGGSPCQGFSFAGKQLNFEDPRSKLFFDFIRLRDKLKPKYVLLENVRMKKESEDIISDYMGCSPIRINSSLLSAQSRNRLYWFSELVDDKYVPINVSQPQDKGIFIKDILEELPFGDIPNYLANNWGGEPRGNKVKSIDDPKANCLTASMYKGQIPTYIKKIIPKENPTVSKDGLIRVGSADLNGHDYLKRVYSRHGKAPTLTANGGGNLEPKVGIARIVNRRLDENGTRKDYQLELPFTKVIELRQDDKSNCLTTLQKDNVVVKEEVYGWRKLTPLECERLQTMPDNYTNHVSNSQRYKMIGNGWTVDVIAHILKGIQHG
jgi:DNA (cytosine-5)-methyltransferase 3A